MKSIDLNIIYILISSVTLIAAIITPILTTVINNRYLLKMKQIEIAKKRENDSMEFFRSVIQDYLVATSACIANPTPEAIHNYGRHYSIAFAYFPQSTHEQLKSINESMWDAEYESANKQLEGLSIFLSSFIKDLWSN